MVTRLKSFFYKPYIYLDSVAEVQRFKWGNSAELRDSCRRSGVGARETAERPPTCQKTFKTPPARIFNISLKIQSIKPTTHI